MQVGEGLLTREEAEECIGIEFNPVRAGFHGGQDVWTRDVLNLGVRPDKAIAKVQHWPCNCVPCCQGISFCCVGLQLLREFSCFTAESLQQRESSTARKDALASSSALTSCSYVCGMMVLGDLHSAV